MKEINFDYKELVGNMSDDAFQFSIKLLYEYMNYKYISQNEVRKIDVMEYLGTLEKDLKKEIGLMGGSEQLYLYMLKKFFTDIIKCKENSRAEKYKKKALSIIANFKTSDSKDADIDDVFVIFISFLRCENYPLEKLGSLIFSDRVFDVCLEDADLLKKLYLNIYIGNITPEFMREFNIFEARLHYKQMEYREYLYFINILYLGKNLEKRGLLGEV